MTGPSMAALLLLASGFPAVGLAGRIRNNNSGVCPADSHKTQTQVCGCSSLKRKNCNKMQDASFALENPPQTCVKDEDVTVELQLSAHTDSTTLYDLSMWVPASFGSDYDRPFRHSKCSVTVFPCEDGGDGDFCGDLIGRSDGYGVTQRRMGGDDSEAEGDEGGDEKLHSGCATYEPVIITIPCRSDEESHLAVPVCLSWDYEAKSTCRNIYDAPTRTCGCDVVSFSEVMVTVQAAEDDDCITDDEVGEDDDSGGSGSGGSDSSGSDNGGSDSGGDSGGSDSGGESEGSDSGGDSSGSDSGGSDSGGDSGGSDSGGDSGGNDSGGDSGGSDSGGDSGGSDSGSEPGSDSGGSDSSGGDSGGSDSSGSGSGGGSSGGGNGIGGCTPNGDVCYGIRDNGCCSVCAEDIFDSERYVCTDGGASGDPHLVGFRGQKFDFTGADGGYYALLAQDDPLSLVTMRVQAPVPGLDVITYIIGFGVKAMDLEGTVHYVQAFVKDPNDFYAHHQCPIKDEPCLAEGALTVVLDGEVVTRPGIYELGPGFEIGAANLPGECRSFGFEKYWTRKVLEANEAAVLASRGRDGRRLESWAVPMDEWILGDSKVTNRAECEDYVARGVREDSLFDFQSEYVSFQITTPALTLRVNHGKLHQLAMRDPTDQFDLPDHRTFQQNIAFERAVLGTHPRGILGETVRPTRDASGRPITHGIEAMRGVEEDYRVSGPFMDDFAMSLDERPRAVASTEVLESL